MLYLARHGETVDNKRQVARGWRPTPLDADGRKEARRLAEVFRGKRIGIVASSDLVRAKQTAETIATKIRAPILYLASWRAWHVGTWTGKKVAAVEADIKACLSQPQTCPHDGEKATRFRKRIALALAAALADAKQLHEESKQRVLIVTHSGVLRMVLGILHYGATSTKAFTYLKRKEDPLPPGGVLYFPPQPITGGKLKTSVIARAEKPAQRKLAVPA